VTSGNVEERKEKGLTASKRVSHRMHALYVNPTLFFEWLYRVRLRDGDTVDALGGVANLFCTTS